MSDALTEATELATALGMLAPDLRSAVCESPAALAGVPVETWERLRGAYLDGEHRVAFDTAFENGRAFLAAEDGLRGRPPRIVEWRGPYRPPGDDIIPADLRVDHVYLISCKYLSKILLNAGPARLFDRLLIGEERAGLNWFAHVAPVEYQRFYDEARWGSGLWDLPEAVVDLDRDQQRRLKVALADRVLPLDLREPWADLCRATAARSAAHWNAALSTPRLRLKLLWRMLRISTATYFVLGSGKGHNLRLRVDSNWDWMQAYDLIDLLLEPRDAGQPEVGWSASVRRRDHGDELRVEGHVEIRWSHGRFLGGPEAKVYLDTPFADVPGYHQLMGPGS